MGGWFAALWTELERAEAKRKDWSPRLPDSNFPNSEELSRALAKIESDHPLYEDSWRRIRTRIDRHHDDETMTGTRARRAIHAEITSLLERSTREKTELNQERALRQVITPLVDHLNETIPDLTVLAREIRSLFRGSAHWNLFDTAWRDIDITRLRPAFAFYRQDTGLQRLAELIADGARASVAPGRIPLPASSRTDAIADAGGAGKTGPLVRDRSLHTVLPSEIALLADDDTSALFEQRYIEAGPYSLLAPHIDHLSRCSDTDRGETPETDESTRLRAPIVLCVDTSGSMRGTPERVVAAFSLGVIRNALAIRRPFRILAFQNGLKEIFWSPYDDSQPDPSLQPALTAPLRIPEDLLLDLTEMIQTELEGGTDSTPVLERALELVEERSGDPTDVILISDITTPKITPSHLNQLYRLQHQRRLRFHALTINRNAMSDPLNVFDYRWHYRAVDPPHHGVDTDSLRGVYLTP